MDARIHYAHVHCVARCQHKTATHSLTRGEEKREEVAHGVFSALRTAAAQS